MVAGTVDVLLYDEGGLVMYDWNRSKKIKRENQWDNGMSPVSHLPDANFRRYALQLNIYKHILEKR